ncbi:MAG: ABC transporter ATP-binding protein [Lachnospiraceae bacterium]|nr:ABC transporter ATP-binding protein [Lachnospiraceae bacterium]
MKNLLKYLKDYKKESIIAPLFKLLEASFELFVPLVVAQIIDVGIANHDRNYIFKMCGALILLAIIGLICAVSAQFFAAKAAVGFAAKLRMALFSHIERLSFADIDRIGTSTLITRMTSDINQLQSGVNMVLRLFMRSPIVVFGAMIMAFTVNVKAAFVFAVTIPLLSVVVFGIMLITIPMFKNVQTALDKVLGKTRENLAGVRVIRAFNKQEQEIIEFNERNEILTNAQIIVGRISALMNPVTLIIVDIATVVIIWIGAKEVYTGVITQGEVVALVSYMSQILVELVKLANLIILITKAIACGNRVSAVLETKSSIIEQKDTENILSKINPKAPMVEFEHVSMCYGESKEEALSDIHFEAKKGQTIGIIGGTGSGKTSLVHLIPRFYDVCKGSVKIEGVDVKDYPLSLLREKIGIVMQKSVLFHGTIAENLRWGNVNATEEELWNALELAQAVDVVKGKEDGLSHKIEQGGKNLSGGQRQRLAIARALVKNPDILILDDSASALDFATDAKLRSALKGISGEKTIFIVSQRTSSIQFADKIIVLEDGEAVGMGTHEELLTSCEVYKEIYDSQFKQERGNYEK